MIYSKLAEIKPSREEEQFQKKPLGRRRHLMSCFARSETANLVSATSGTERERGFVGIVPPLCEPLSTLYPKQL